MSHLTDAQRETFRARLEAAQAAARELLDQTAADLEPVDASGSSIGRLTRMDALQVQGMAQMSRHQLSVRLQQIEIALAAVKAGTYGTCRHCKGPIALPRLEALPETPFCIGCQEGFERER